MAFLKGFKDMFKKAMKKVRKYADGGNVASGSPNYGFSQMNPMQAGGLGALRPAPLTPPQQGMASATPPAFNNAAPPASGPMAARPTPFKKGGKVKAKSKKSSASRRGDGIASKGKTKGRFV
jgi:hypothetical protein